MPEVFDPIWKTATFTAADLEAIQEGSDVPSPAIELGDPQYNTVRFEIPKYQRGLRWSEKKQAEFLDSLRRGLPTGSIVLARKFTADEEAGTLRRWYVLDGQQRIGAFRNLIEKFWSARHYDFDEIIADVERIWGLLDDDEKASAIKKNFIEALKATIAASSGPAEPLKLLLGWFAECKIPFPAEPQERQLSIQESCGEIRTKLLRQFDGLKNYPISALLLLPHPGSPVEEQNQLMTEVFITLNDGVPLDKYEILAAMWHDRKVRWEPDLKKREVLCKWMREKMDSRIDDSYADSESYEPVVEELIDVGLFDLLYALSQATAWEMPKTKTGQATKSRTYVLNKAQAEIAFNVMNLVVQAEITLMDDLPADPKTGISNFPIDSDGCILAEGVIESYMEAVEGVAQSIHELTGFGPKLSNRKPLGLTQTQVYLANYTALFRDTRDFSPRSAGINLGNEGQVSISSAKKRWLGNLRAWWLYDWASDELQGSDGHANAKKRVWIDKIAGLPNTQMCNAPSLEALLANLSRVFVAESAPGKASATRSQSDVARSLMFLAYSGFTAGQPIEIDHVVPFHPKKEAGKAALNKPINLNHIANWMPLEKSINSSRGNKPWATYIDDVESIERDKIRDRLLLPAPRFTNDLVDSREAFLRVMLERWVVLLDRALVRAGIDRYQALTSDERKTLLETETVVPIIAGLKAHGVALDLKQLKLDSLNLNQN